MGFLEPADRKGPEVSVRWDVGGELFKLSDGVETRLIVNANVPSTIVCDGKYGSEEFGSGAAASLVEDRGRGMSS